MNTYVKGENYEVNPPKKECVLDFNRAVSAWISGIFRQCSICIR